MKRKICTIVVLHYGDVKKTLACVESLLDNGLLHGKYEFTIIISSNGTQKENQLISKWCNDNISTYFDATRDFLKWKKEKQNSNGKNLFGSVREWSQCIMIRNEENLGFSAGNNPAIEYSLQYQAEIVWLLNNDSIVSKGTLSSLAECYENTNGKSIIGATVVGADNPGIIQCAGGVTFNPCTTCIYPAFAGELLENIDQLQHPEFDYIYGAAMLVPAQAFKDIGLLNEDFFLFYEEMDFCLRAKQAGYSLMWGRDVLLVHQSESSKKDSWFRIFHSIRSLIIFCKIHYSEKWHAMVIVHVLGRVLVQFSKKNFTAMGAIAKGVKSGLFFK